MWSRKFGGLVALAGIGLILAGCGFQPLYGSSGGTAVRADLASVNVERIPDREGQQLRNFLTERLHANGAAASRYSLSVTVSESISELGFRKDDIATRAQLTQAANYSLTETRSGERIFSSQIRTTNSYNILESEFGTLVTEGDARRRGLEQLADSIAQRIALALRHGESEGRAVDGNGDDNSSDILQDDEDWIED